MQLVREANATPDRRRPSTRLLINTRTDVALAIGADGVHLRSTDISPAIVRDILAACTEKRLSFCVAISCHSIQEVRDAESAGASFAVFAPVFEKLDAPTVQITGFETLAEASRSKIPILALGGVTLRTRQSAFERAPRESQEFAIPKSPDQRRRRLPRSVGASHVALAVSLIRQRLFMPASMPHRNR
jgi:thiamine monophosphate synthase